MFGYLDNNKQNQTLADDRDGPFCLGCGSHASLSAVCTLDLHPVSLARNQM